jgi:hypothetical protein
MAVVPEDMRDIFHTQKMHNDFCLIGANEADMASGSGWKTPDGKNVLLVSVNGVGEVRWAIWPRQLVWSPEDYDIAELTQEFGLVANKVE